MGDMANDNARRLADRIILQAMQLMDEQGIPIPVMIERLLTVSGAQLAANRGSDHAAHVFREAARAIDAGELAKVERRTSKH